MKVYIMSMGLSNPTPNTLELEMSLKATGKVQPNYYRRLSEAMVNGKSLEITLRRKRNDTNKK